MKKKHEEKSYAEVACEMEKYLKNIKREAKENPELARKNAYSALYKSGIVTKTGYTITAILRCCIYR